MTGPSDEKTAVQLGVLAEQIRHMSTDMERIRHALDRNSAEVQAQHGSLSAVTTDFTKALSGLSDKFVTALDQRDQALRIAMEESAKNSSTALKEAVKVIDARFVEFVRKSEVGMVDDILQRVVKALTWALPVAIGAIAYFYGRSNPSP